MRKLLDNAPRFQGLPARAPQNNLGQLGRARSEKVLRVIQQNLLNVLRVMGHQLDRPKIQMDIMLQCWQYVAEMYWRVNQERKELSCPGIGAQKDPHQEELFGKDDVQALQSETKLQKMRSGSVNSGVNALPHLGSPFRSTPGPYRSWKGQSS